jgi:hypothetical protein
MLKKRDFVLLTVFIAVGILISILIFLPKQQNGTFVCVKINGLTTATYPLDTDIIVRLDTGQKSIGAMPAHTDRYNMLEIRDGVASIIEANCKDQLCVHQKGISTVGESIICLPHLLTLTITDDKEDTPDAVA